jgi:hypothetical protein
VEEIIFPKDSLHDGLQAFGRNGYMKCHGLEVSDIWEAVELTPITSRGNAGRCFIRIPYSSIPNLIAALRQIFISSRKGATNDPVDTHEAM